MRLAVTDCFSGRSHGLCCHKMVGLFQYGVPNASYRLKYRGCRTRHPLTSLAEGESGFHGAFGVPDTKLTIPRLPQQYQGVNSVRERIWAWTSTRVKCIMELSGQANGLKS